MTRAFTVHSDGTLDLYVGTEMVATLPFPNMTAAQDFGQEFVERTPERQAAMQRHPAGRRLAE